MKKKLAIFIMTALLTLAVSIPASAASYTTNLSNVHNDEITEVNPERTAEIEKLNDERSKLLQSDDQGEKLAENQKKLEDLGVEFLSTNEVQQRFGDDAPVADLLNAIKAYESNSVSPSVNPPQKSGIVWESFRNDFTKNGIVYEVQHLTAKPSSSSSSPLQGTNVAVIQTNKLI